MRQSNYWFEDVYQNGSLKWLPFSCEINVDCPTGAVGRLNLSVCRIPMMIHDCGCGISVFFMKSPPREKEIERIRDIYSAEYVDEELQELIPAEANLPLRKQWSFYRHDPTIYENQYRKVYFCEQRNLYAMKLHYSHYPSRNAVFRYLLDKYGENVKGENAIRVYEFAKILQEYSIRARRHYVKQVGEIVELFDSVDCPHVSIDEDGIFRFGVQRGETVVQTTDKHLWLFDGMLSDEFYGCSVGSLPGMTHLLDQEKFFNEYCEKTRHLATLKETYVAIT